MTGHSQPPDHCRTLTYRAIDIYTYYTFNSGCQQNNFNMLMINCLNSEWPIHLLYCWLSSSAFSYLLHIYCSLPHCCSFLLVVRVRDALPNEVVKMAHINVSTITHAYGQQTRIWKFIVIWACKKYRLALIELNGFVGDADRWIRNATNGRPSQVYSRYCCFCCYCFDFVFLAGGCCFFLYCDLWFVNRKIGSTIKRFAMQNFASSHSGEPPSQLARHPTRVARTLYGRWCDSAMDSDHRRFRFAQKLYWIRIKIERWQISWNSLSVFCKIVLIFSLPFLAVSNVSTYCLPVRMAVSNAIADAHISHHVIHFKFKCLKPEARVYRNKPSEAAFTVLNYAAAGIDGYFTCCH